MKTKYIFASVLAMVPAWASAALFSVSYTTTPSDFYNNGGAVFGVSSPTTVSTRFLLDTTAGPSVFIPAGTVLGNGSPAYAFATDLYGYSAASISELSVTFGTQTWTVNDIVPFNLNSSAVPAMAIWFNQALQAGAHPTTWMYLSNPSGSFSFGACTTCNASVGGTSAQLDNFSMVFDTISGHGVQSAFNSNITTVNTVPIPAAVWLFGSGLVGLVPFARRNYVGIA
jgi:hypothetical protein